MEATNNLKFNLYLMHKQHLLPDSQSYNIVQVADDLCGLHATIPTTPYLSLFVRMHSFRKADLKYEIEIKKSLVRTRSIRSTIHLLPVEKSPQIFTATRSQQNRRSEKYLMHLGMTPDEFNSSAEKILIVLAGKGLTANEIKKETGIPKNTSQVINILCDEGTIVRGAIHGSWKSNIHSYHRFEDFFENSDIRPIPAGEAMESLLMSYIRTYGPVTPEDIIWWSGINRSEVKNILLKNRAKFQEVNSPEGIDAGLMLKEDYKAFQKFLPPEEVFINFLPSLDPYIMGYKDRDRFIDKSHLDYIYDRFGNSVPTIISNGRIMGIWDLDEGDKRIKFFLFEKVDDFIYEKIIENGLKTSRFYCETDTDILEIREVTPVKELTVGSFMSPLKNA